MNKDWIFSLGPNLSQVVKKGNDWFVVGKTTWPVSCDWCPELAALKIAQYKTPTKHRYACRLDAVRRAFQPTAAVTSRHT